ncbi:hypothetical protein [Methanocalculus sp. MC3]
MAPQEKPKTWIIIRDGATVKDNAIEALAFAEAVSNMQRAVDNIGISKFGKAYKKEDFRLYLKEIREGSIIVPLFPVTYGTGLDGENTFTDITGCFERLMDILNTNPDAFPTHLDKEIEDPSARIGLLKSLLSFASSGSTIEIKTSIEQPDHGSFIPKHQKEYLEELVFKYGGTGIVTIQGVIVGIRGDNLSYFIVNTTVGRNINCYFKPEIEDQVKNLYKKWVRVTGNMIQTQKNYKIDSVENLEQVKFETLHKIGQYILLKPITFTVSYDNNDKQWCLFNNDLALYGCGDNYKKAIQSLEEEIEGHILSFSEYPDDMHSESSLQLKQGLLQYLDFNEVKGLIDTRYGGA